MQNLPSQCPEGVPTACACAASLTFAAKCQEGSITKRRGVGLDFSVPIQPLSDISDTLMAVACPIAIEAVRLKLARRA